MKYHSIAVCADFTHKDYLDVFLKSLYLTSSKSQKILNLYLVLKDFPPEIIHNYKKNLQTNRRYKIDVRIILVRQEKQPELYNLYIKSRVYSSQMYLKLLLSHLLPDNEDTVLYLDPTTLLTDNIFDLLSMPVDDNVSLYCARDHLLNSELTLIDSNSQANTEQYGYLIHFKKLFDELQNPELNTEFLTSELTAIACSNANKYKYNLFNDSVMLINLRRLRKLKYYQQYLKFLASPSIIELPHCDLFLNLIHKNDWQAIPESFNYQVSYILKQKANLENKYSKLKNHKDPSLKALHESLVLPKIINFAGKWKPTWAHDVDMPFRRYFYALWDDNLDEVANNKNLYSNTLTWNWLYLVNLDANGNFVGDLLNTNAQINDIWLVSH